MAGGQGLVEQVAADAAVAAKMVSFMRRSRVHSVCKRESMETILYEFEINKRSARRPGPAALDDHDRKESMRELSIQLSLLNHQVGAHLDLKDVDLDCLDTSPGTAR